MSTPALISLPWREPSEIRAGDTVAWQRGFDSYPASGGFSLAYAIVSGAAAYQVGSAAVQSNGDLFVVTLPATLTATWAAGSYRWQAFIADGQGNRWTVDEGVLAILPNLQLVPSTGLDERADEEKMLDAIKALLAGKVLEDAQNYKIHGRELQRYTFAELEKLRAQYARRVRELRVRRGERVTSRTVKVGFCG